MRNSNTRRENVVNQFSSEQLATLTSPCYVYDLRLLNETIQMVKTESESYGYHVHYALKANSNMEILKPMVEAGLGADCVSGNEISMARKAGFTGDKIAFAGVGKADREIEAALNEEILCFNCESVPELEVINEIAQKHNKTARVALRINPNVNAKTHHYITTGLEENKFGINPWELDMVLEKLHHLKHIELIGIHFHIGSQITDLSVFKGLCIRVNELQQWFHDKHVKLEIVNVGGGLGIDYQHPDQHSIADFTAYFSLFDQFLNLYPNQQLHFELGRSVVAQCGSLLTRVLYVKEGVKTNFAIVDAGMTELLRPALYQAYHKIEHVPPVSEPYKKVKYDVVGPICESSDCFGKAVLLHEIKRGDWLAIRSTGAYGEVMSNAYNLRDKAKAYYF